MAIGIARRKFISALGGRAIAWPLAVRAKQAERMRRVGVLMIGPEGDRAQQTQITAFQQTLRNSGWIEDRNMKTYVRWGLTQAKELVALEPDVILASPTIVLIPLQKATSSIPIIFVGVSDPLSQGIVTSLSRPTGNVTGFSNPEFSLVGKSVQLLKEVAPRLSRLALLIATTNGAAAGYLRSFDVASRSFAVTPVIAVYNDLADAERTIDEFSRQPNGGLFFPRDATTTHNKDSIVESVAWHGLPAVYAEREIVASGGLMSYGTDPVDPFRGAASYVDRILRRAKPSDLPVQEPTRFELVINLKTAKALGLTIPLPLVGRADEVIE